MKKMYPEIFCCKSSLLLACFCLISAGLYAQSPPTATVKGRAYDSLASAPLPFAGIRVFKSADKKLEKENVTSETGDFSIEVGYGRYYAQFDFMGYKPYRTREFTLSKEHPVHDCGVIQLTPSANTLQEVVVQAEKSSMQLSLDKKIFNVGKDLANAGGSASDILTNIPSVSVDPEGNVKLR